MHLHQKMDTFAMINVLRFLIRAEHLPLAEFRDWWLQTRRHMTAALRKPYLKHYVIDIRWKDATLKHVSRFERLVLHEHAIPVRTEA